MSYQQHCEDFATYGDPKHEAYLSEMNARYDYIKELEAENADNFSDDEQYEWLIIEEPVAVRVLNEDDCPF